MKYIAYGSNMSRGQMKHRCPDARLIGTGWVEDMQLVFKGRMSGNAHATLVPAPRGKGPKRHRVPVAVWELSNRDETSLDSYEGFPHYYRKEQCPVTLSNGRAINGMVYLMNGGQLGMPSRSYYFGIRDAYIDLGLEEHVNPILGLALAASMVWCPDEWKAGAYR
ncbi:gamma-glutamylcyclotransferase [Eubacteriales bacterium OttesenSCG-928-N13]|nr:gamma-glutamylcyclotransferase [Eubacteriales bacterium OttesenSCG-928-N13]